MGTIVCRLMNLEKIFTDTFFKNIDMKNYSQNNEQEFILNYLGESVGNFLDIGSNDGVTLSNTHALALLGWYGTCVDASPTAFKRLCDNYVHNDKIQMILSAIGDYNGTVTLHESGELLGVGDVALVSSTRQDETERWTSLDIPFTDVVVPCATFKTLLERLKHDHFDFLSIDIEGDEILVVPQIDFKKLGTKMAIIEWNGRAGNFYDDIMFPQGFKLLHANAENRIYAI